MILERQLLPLLLCYAAKGEPVLGRTRFQKILFLIQEDSKVKGGWKKYQFIPENFGPFSIELQQDIDDLVRQDLIKVMKQTVQDGMVKYQYYVSPKGVDEVQKMLSDSQMKERVSGLLSFMDQTKPYLNRMDLQRLVQKIHEKYPNYVKKPYLY